MFNHIYNLYFFPISHIDIYFGILDQDVLNALEPWKEKLIKQFPDFYKVVGRIEESLKSSRTEESTLGNFVTDAMVHFVSTYLLKLGEKETNKQI
jgi:hypothetical protein